MRRWPSRGPWEKFNRQTSTPASNKRSSVSTSLQAGPIVATILVRIIKLTQRKKRPRVIHCPSYGGRGWRKRRERGNAGCSARFLQGYLLPIANCLLPIEMRRIEGSSSSSRQLAIGNRRWAAGVPTTRVTPGNASHCTQKIQKCELCV